MLLLLAPAAASSRPAKCRCACLGLSEPRRISKHTSMPQSVVHFACALVRAANDALKHGLGALPALTWPCFPRACADQGAVRWVKGLKEAGLVLQTAIRRPNLRHSAVGSRRDAGAGDPADYKWQAAVLLRKLKSVAAGRVVGRGGSVNLLT